MERYFVYTGWVAGWEACSFPKNKWWDVVGLSKKCGDKKYRALHKRYANATTKLCQGIFLLSLLLLRTLDSLDLGFFFSPLFANFSSWRRALFFFFSEDDLRHRIYLPLLNQNNCFCRENTRKFIFYEMLITQIGMLPFTLSYLFTLY